MTALQEYPHPEGWGLCPRCGEWFNATIPALSRADNETHVCSSCGKDEAMMDASGHIKTGPGPHRTVLPSWRKRFPDLYDKESFSTTVDMQYFCSPAFEADARRNLAKLDEIQRQMKESADAGTEEGEGPEA